MSYQYGVSFNCYVGRDSVGGADECCDVAYVSNNYWKLIEHVIAENGNEFSYKAEHELVNHESNVGGTVLGVFVEDADTDDEFIVAVLIARPNTPEVVE